MGGIAEMKQSDKLHARYSKKKKDVQVFYPLGIQTGRDARYLFNILSKSVMKELTDRGYDITTLKFEICPQKGNEKFASQREGECKNES